MENGIVPSHRSLCKGLINMNNTAGYFMYHLSPSFLPLKSKNMEVNSCFLRCDSTLREGRIVSCSHPYSRHMDSLSKWKSQHSRFGREMRIVARVSEELPFLPFQTWVSEQMSWYHHLSGYKIIRKGKSNGKVQMKRQRNLKETQHGLPGGQTVGFIPLMLFRSEYILACFLTNTQHLKQSEVAAAPRAAQSPWNPAPEHCPREASWLPKPLQCVTLGCMSTTAALSPGCRTCPAPEVPAPAQLDPPLQHPTALLLHDKPNCSCVQERFNHSYSNHKKCFYKLFSIKRTEIICNRIHYASFWFRVSDWPIP